MEFRMNLAEYQALAARTMPADRKSNDQITNMCLGLAGESGEVIEHVKKAVFHGHDLSPEYLEKEIGDVLWYVAGMATAMGLDLNTIAENNISKLKQRYPEGFSESASTTRID